MPPVSGAGCDLMVISWAPRKRVAHCRGERATGSPALRQDSATAARTRGKGGMFTSALRQTKETRVASCSSRMGRMRNSPARCPGSASARMPTVAESGVPKYESVSWNGFVVPTGVPKDIVNRLQRDIDTVLKRPAMVEKLAAMGAEPVGGTAEQFAAHIRNETRRWGELIDRMGIKPQ